jgi:hypothetical protein
VSCSAVAMNSKRSSRTCPINFTGVDGASCWVLSFTDTLTMGPSFLLFAPWVVHRTEHDRLRIIRGRLFACGTAAEGDTFRFAGGFARRLLANTTSMKPACT